MEKIKNICMVVSIVLLMLLFFIYYTKINNYSSPYIKEYLDNQTPDSHDNKTEKKMCDEGCFLAPINTQIININTRLDALEKLGAIHDSTINNNTLLLANLQSEIKKTKDELEQELNKSN
jgi:uncharacterized coiled-coil protein SlyX